MSEEEAIYNLINAIIEQAVKDYRFALKHPNREESPDTIRDCERFFRSGWFEFLTDVDGEYLIHEIKGGRKNQ